MLTCRGAAALAAGGGQEQIAMYQGKFILLTGTGAPPAQKGTVLDQESLPFPEMLLPDPPPSTPLRARAAHACCSV